MLDEEEKKTYKWNGWSISEYWCSSHQPSAKSNQKEVRTLLNCVRWSIFQVQIFNIWTLLFLLVGLFFPMIFVSSFFFFGLLRNFNFQPTLVGPTVFVWNKTIECVRSQIQFFSCQFERVSLPFSKNKIWISFWYLWFLWLFLSLLINDSFSSKQFILMSISTSLADKNTEIVKSDVMIVVWTSTLSLVFVCFNDYLFSFI